MAKQFDARFYYNNFIANTKVKMSQYKSNLLLGYACLRASYTNNHIFCMIVHSGIVTISSVGSLIAPTYSSSDTSWRFTHNGEFNLMIVSIRGCVISTI